MTKHTTKLLQKAGEYLTEEEKKLLQEHPHCRLSEGVRHKAADIAFYLEMRKVHTKIAADYEKQLAEEFEGPDCCREALDSPIRSLMESHKEEAEGALRHLDKLLAGEPHARSRLRERGRSQSPAKEA